MKQIIFFVLGTTFLSAGLGVCGYLAGEPTTTNTPVIHRVPDSVFASASSESDGVVLATGSFNSNVEVLYYLDSQSCRLSAGLVSRSAPVFQKSFSRNLKRDLLEAAEQFNIPVPTTPKFLMVTGQTDIRNVGTVANISQSLAYIAEINTGIVFTYALPNANDRDLTISNGEIILWTYARLNDGLNAVSASEQPSSPSSPMNDTQLINSGFYRVQ